MSEHIARWHAEHANYYKLLDLLESLTETFTQRNQPDYDLMSDVVYYMTQYPDRFHHPREDVAFRRLLARDPGIAHVIGELSNQHLGISASGAALSDDLRTAAEGALILRATLQADVRVYAALLRYHMDVEEREIFPRLAALLDDEDWFLVDSAIHFAADPVFGDIVQERFRAIHRHIARMAGCGCKESRRAVCHLD